MNKAGGFSLQKLIANAKEMAYVQSEKLFIRFSIYLKKNVMHCFYFPKITTKII